jgi:glycyl-tRNA synthetase beta chain
VTSAPLLVELQTEELPPKALDKLAHAFANGIASGLRERHFLAPESTVTVFGAPRRMGACITHVSDRSLDQPFRQRLLPASIGLDAVGNATAALLKKLATLGGSIDPASLKRETDGKQEVLVYEGVKTGETLVAGLQAALDESLARLPIPKVMNYQLADGVTTVQFVRPAHRLVALHGHAVVPVQALGLLAGTKTFGHRFHSQGEIAVHSAATYEDQLEREGRVIVSFAKRRARVVELLNAAAQKVNASPLMPDDLVDEVTALVEWPVVYESGFEAEFLEVPPECLVLTMQQHQRYFPLQDAGGKLLNRFLLVSHLEANDGGEAIRTGNARVVRARLADAKFFYDQDRKRSLESRVPLLAKVVYHNKLGSQLERVERLVGIAVQIARAVGADVAHVERAARLAKADLRTEMVGEFPELQGTMGRYYALHDGETVDVADAIAEHYRPRFADDELPRGLVGVCVALADKLEALVGLFAIGEKPTGDKDPYGLRRHAIGILRILIDRQLPLELVDLVAFAGNALGSKVTVDENRLALVYDFFADRLTSLLRESGYSANEVDAVLAEELNRVDLVPAKLAAVRAFMLLPEAESLVAANKRIGNILKKSTAVIDAFDPAHLFEPAEKELSTAYARVKPVAEDLFSKGDYTGMLKSLAPLKLPVDRFFDDVMVNVDDATLRNNRLALLASLRQTMNRVADLSRLAAA